VNVNVRGDEGGFGEVMGRGDPLLLMGSEAFNSTDATVFYGQQRMLDGFA
jgi:hypothetical protein